MNSYIYVNKELFDTVILPLEIYKKKNDERGLIEALIGMGCEVMSKAHVKHVARLGDFVLAKYDGWFLPFEITKRNGNTLTLESYFYVNSFKEFRKKIDPDFYTNAIKWNQSGNLM